jgi:hypothetical protein
MMDSNSNSFLDRVDQWKFKVHEKLSGMTAAERLTFWNKIHEEGRARGLPVFQSEDQSELAGTAKKPTVIDTN